MKHLIGASGKTRLLLQEDKNGARKVVLSFRKGKDRRSEALSLIVRLLDLNNRLTWISPECQHLRVAISILLKDRSFNTKTNAGYQAYLSRAQADADDEYLSTASEDSDEEPARVRILPAGVVSQLQTLCGIGQFKVFLRQLKAGGLAALIY